MTTVHALVIENNQDSIMVLSHLLQAQGATCVAIDHPRELENFDFSDIDVIFLDLDLPGMNGYEVFDMLRNEYQLQMPILAYTVNLNEKATTRNMGFNGIIEKPVDSECFAFKFEKLLQGQPVWDDC